jgi:hypothetical protein
LSLLAIRVNCLLSGLIQSSIAALNLSRTSFEVRKFQMGERLKRRRHHVKHRQIRVSENLLGNFERR